MPRPLRPLIAALDLGTSAVKAAFIDVNGDLLAATSIPVTTTHLAGGGVEQNPTDWVEAAEAAIAACIAEVGTAEAGRVAGLGLTGHMQDLVLLPASTPSEATPHSLGPAVLYSDQRAAHDAAALQRDIVGWERLIGNEPDATALPAQWARLSREGDPRLATARRLVCGPAGYLAWTLGLGSWCDATTATTTGMARPDGSGWVSEVADAAGIPARVLPGIVAGPTSILGRLATGHARRLGLPAGIPVVLAPGDAATTTIGIVGTQAGQPYAYLGATGWVGVLADLTALRPPACHLLAVPATGATHAPTRLAIAALASAGSTAEWAARMFLPNTDDPDAELAHWENDHGRTPTGLLALPSLAGERFPRPDRHTRCRTRWHAGRHRCLHRHRAMCEGVGYALRHALTALTPSGFTGELPIAGGATRSQPWMRMIADILGVPLRIVSHQTATVTGCALATATVLGLNHRIRPLAHRPDATVYTPDPTAANAYAASAETHLSLYEILAHATKKTTP